MCPAESFSGAYIRTRLLIEKADQGDEKHVVGVEIMTPGRIVLAPEGAGGGAVYWKSIRTPTSQSTRIKLSSLGRCTFPVAP